ncbi:MAG: hypothetical protein WCF49_23115, partial [Xanthobacteraceae bacterium]
MLNSEGVAAVCPSIFRGREWRNFTALHFGRCWHEADIKLRPLFGRYGVESGHHRLVMSISAFDPSQTSADLLPPAKFT